MSENVTTEVGQLWVNKGDIPSLNGLRAISMVLVLTGHSIPFGPYYSFSFRALFLHSDLGVRIFFVISGFLITTLLLNEQTQSGSISLGLFYLRRAFRILPAFFLFIGCVALLSFYRVAPVPASSWLYVLTYTANFAPYPPFPWVLIHLWSLSVEEQFYLLWPLVMKVASQKTCAAVAILAIIANPIIHGFHKFCGVHLPPGYGPFPLVCAPIAMGCLLATFAGRVRSWIVSSKALSSGPVLLLTVLLVAMLDGIPPSSAAVLLQTLTNSLLTLCVARLIFIPTGVTSRVLNSAPLVLIGKLSYSLYLWQQLFLNPNAGTNVDGLPSAHVPIFVPFPLNFLLIVAAASASYWGVEVRFIGLRRRFRKGAAVQSV